MVIVMGLNFFGRFRTSPMRCLCGLLVKVGRVMEVEA